MFADGYSQPSSHEPPLTRVWSSALSMYIFLLYLSTYLSECVHMYLYAKIYMHVSVCVFDIPVLVKQRKTKSDDFRLINDAVYLHGF